MSAAQPPGSDYYWKLRAEAEDALARGRNEYEEHLYGNGASALDELFAPYRDYLKKEFTFSGLALRLLVINPYSQHFSDWLRRGKILIPKDQEVPPSKEAEEYFKSERTLFHFVSHTNHAVIVDSLPGHDSARGGQSAPWRVSLGKALEVPRQIAVIRTVGDPPEAVAVDLDVASLRQEGREYEVDLVDNLHVCKELMPDAWKTSWPEPFKEAFNFLKKSYPEWDAYINLPSSTVVRGKDGERTAAGSIVVLLGKQADFHSGRDEVLGRALPLLHAVLCATLDKLAIWEARYETKRHATRAAVAAIMGRNMSHNIGSHVLHYLAEYDPFYAYLQDRMNFVAQVAMSSAIWSQSVPFVRRVIQPFFEGAQDRRSGESPGMGDHRLVDPDKAQYCFLDNIVRSEIDLRDGEESCAKKLTFEVDVLGENVTYSAPSGRFDGGPGAESVKDVFVEMREGLLGIQAFYSILEGMLRNSAKHREDRAAPLKMCVTVAEPRGLPEFYEVRVSDGVRIPASRMAELRKNLELPKGTRPGLVGGAVISDGGSINKANLGFKEMRSCAAWLRLRRPEDVDQPASPPLLHVNERRLDDHNELEIVFYLYRSKDVLLLTRSGKLHDREALGGAGVDVVQSVSDVLQPGRFRHRFLVVDFSGMDDDERRSLGKALPILRYPILLLHSDPHRADQLEKEFGKSPALVQERNIEGLLGTFAESPGDVVLWAHRQWLRHLWPTGEGDVPHLTVHWKKGKESCDCEWWTDNDHSIKKKDADIQWRFCFDHGASNRGARHEAATYYEPFTTVGAWVAASRLTALVERWREAPRQAALAYYRMAEAAVTRVVVVDERLQRASGLKRYLPGGSRELGHIWADIGVSVCEINEAGHISGAADHGHPQDIGGFLDGCGAGDIVLVHQSLIEKTVGIEAFVKAIERPGFRVRAPRIIMHTGKGSGRPSGVPAWVKHLDFSNIEQWLVREPDKHMLVELLMSA